MPLLNAEAHVPVCIHPFDSNNGRPLAEGKSKSALKKPSNQSQSSSGAFAPKVFSNSQKESFLNTLKTFASKSALGSKLDKSEWQLVLTQTQDCNSSIVDTVLTQVLRKGPFACLIEGTNGGKPCVTGVFSSQSVSDFVFENYSYEKIYQIPYAEDCFFFYYEDDFNMHFNIPNYPGQNYILDITMNSKMVATEFPSSTTLLREYS